MKKLNLSQSDVEERQAGNRASFELLSQKPSPQLKGRDIILIDDGLATGYTMMAAVKSVREENPGRIIVAVPVSPSSTCEHGRASASGHFIALN
ncbi:MAG: hypothetical protein L0387_44660 [Acidobacteria bacterium]|nr:hypothetical protein [Acidobacteriota bacterium]MCI0628671.1 hypothetical protein [Acidobacteriota bacterium]MCI0720756.1 hypothetical protein [Acidobacteriota bacterium]